MKRSHIRTPQGWARFDFFAIIILIVLVVLLLLLWLLGTGPSNEDCCQDDDSHAQEAYVTPSPAPTPTALPPKEPYVLIINSSSQGVSVSGVVADDTTRQSILTLVTDTFSTTRPSSSLAVARNIATFDASLSNQNRDGGNSGDLAALIGQLGNMEEAQLSLDPERIKLTGGVADQATFDQISELLAQFESDERSVSNQIELIEDTIVEEAPVAEPVDCAAVLRASQVEFQFGSAELTAAGKAALRTALQCLSQENYLIVGHTDAIGKEEDNLALSEARARAAREYLVSIGVRSERISATGKGEADPIATNETAQGRAENRRIEFIPQ